MRVRLCAECPCAPRDLAGHYDPDAVLHACAKCDGEQEVPAGHYPRETMRSRKCVTFPQIFVPNVLIPNVCGTARPGVAPSVTESLV